MSKNFRNLCFEGPKGYFNISPDLCKSCGLCKEKCPTDVLDWSEELGVYGSPMIEPVRMEQCTACGICQMVCPDAAILIEKKKKAPKTA
ncbi:MAG: ferredoxin family protein [Firmicutes bacterium]|jgi:2-oxoglutarate ferredoxin oxidoreductase subunit delta|nr:ferredoxin family protein [Bacillota bacterium]